MAGVPSYHLVEKVRQPPARRRVMLIGPAEIAVLGIRHLRLSLHGIQACLDRARSALRSGKGAGCRRAVRCADRKRSHATDQAIPAVVTSAS